MKVQTDCLACILNMTIGAMKRLGMDESGNARELLGRIMALPGYSNVDWSRTSPEVIEDVMREFHDFVGNPDPFVSIKDNMNRLAQRFVPRLTERIANSNDPFETAARLAILGNALDFMVPFSEEKFEEVIETQMKMPLSEDAVSELKRRVTEAGLIVILGDNAGEIVFDRLFIMEMKKITGADMVFVVRTQPVMNDATMDEAKQVGLDEVIRVIGNGIDGPVPGTVLDRCSPEVHRLLMEADLVVSKGGGNFDSLHEDLDRTGPVTFMLLSKCRPYVTFLNTEIGRPIMAHF